MKRKYSAALCLSILLIFFSCTVKAPPRSFPVPDSGINPNENPVIIEIGNILETKNGPASQMPSWLRSYLGSGINAVERLDAYNNKYVFIVSNEGDNVTVLTKWVDYYTVTHDFPMLVADRIEKRMYLTASLYPDDEYGAFYETMMHNAYKTEYPRAVKEDYCWIKTKSGNAEEPSENYIFYLLITIEKYSMQSIIRNMIAKTSEAVTLTKSQNNAVNKLRNTFFEGF
ncbi:MAG: hypothetical protein FWF68_03480 [Spirochaetes bacterium]|nr:hypothetical protein [Spirochaetota bacterium]